MVCCIPLYHFLHAVFAVLVFVSGVLFAVAGPPGLEYGALLAVTGTGGMMYTISCMPYWCLCLVRYLPSQHFLSKIWREICRIL